MARGGMWLSFGSFGENGLRMIRNMILTRLLVPDVIGLMAIILAVNMFFESFTQVGLREAVIQNERGNDKAFLNSAFLLSAGRSLILFAIAFVLIPFVADIYEHPELVPMMRVAFLGFVFFGFLSPRSYSELKEMNYSRWVIIYHGGSLIGIATTIVLSYFYRNIWSLVIGNVVEQFSRMVLSYIVCPFVPSFRGERESLTSLLTFARGMFGIPILVFIYMRADVLVIGKLCTEADTGLYNMANSIVQYPFLLYSSIFHPILLPAFSPHQNNHEKLRSMILKSSGLLALFYIPGLTLLGCLAVPILSHVFTPEYALVSVPFMILCVNTGFRTLGSVIVSALIAIGKPEYTREASIVRSVLTVALIYPMVKYWGLTGAPIALSIASVSWLLASLIRLRKSLGLSYFKYVATFLPGMAVSAVIVAIWGLSAGLLSLG